MGSIRAGLEPVPNPISGSALKYEALLNASITVRLGINTTDCDGKFEFCFVAIMAGKSDEVKI